LDRPALRHLLDAGFLAEGFRGTDAGAHAAHDVGAEDGPGRADCVARHDLANEERDVDGGGTGLDAGRIVAEQAALGGDPRLMPVEGRREVGKIMRQRFGIETTPRNVRLCSHRNLWSVYFLPVDQMRSRLSILFGKTPE